MMPGTTISVLFAFGLFVVGCLLAGRTIAQQDVEELFDIGITEYELSCMSCHGVDGRGDGPDAQYLDTKPADLTQIKKANGGFFPADRVAMIIDGRAVVAMHGAREMPVWGERYRRPIPDVDGAWDTERDARSRIEALVDCVESLQAP
jgi:mono/diheme cytochrome c family protein